MRSDHSCNSSQREGQFEAAALKHLQRLYRTAFRYLRNREDAEDAVQEALLSAFRHLSEFQGRAQISTWLYRIVVNAARMRSRELRKRTFVSLDQPAEGDSEVYLVQSSSTRTVVANSRASSRS